MYGIFSFIFVSFLSPFFWVMVLLLIAAVSKKPNRKKRALLGAIIVLFVFSNPYLLYLYASKWDVPPAPLNNGKVYSAAIILGGFASEDKDGSGYFNDHSDRLIEGMRLKVSGRVSHIMTSGGNNAINADQFTESGYVSKVLKEFNFPDSVILTDEKSKNTGENAVYTKQALASAHLQPPYLLITSAFHMRRAEYVFKKKGMDVLPYPCDYITAKSKPGLLDYFIPSVYTLHSWNFYIKELFGVAIAHISS